jgi:hypothetical protein
MEPVAAVDLVEWVVRKGHIVSELVVDVGLPSRARLGNIRSRCRDGRKEDHRYRARPGGRMCFAGVGRPEVAFRIELEAES